MKHIALLSACALVGGILMGDIASGAKLAHYWNFDQPGGGDAVAERLPIGGAIADTLGHDSSGLWTLKRQTSGSQENGDLATFFPVKNLGINNSPDSGKYYSTGNDDRYLHLGVDNDRKGSYMTCEGTQLDFGKEWSYSVTSWLMPQASNQQSIALFSIGASDYGMNLVYNQDLGTLKFEMNGLNVISNDIKSLGSIAPPQDSLDYRHVGFSMESDGNGKLTIKYYLNGVAYDGGSITVEDATLLNGFTLGAAGKDGGDTQSCNYDDVKIFTGVLDDKEILDAMEKGQGNFEIDIPAVPEPSSALLSCLGLAAMVLRRRRA